MINWISKFKLARAADGVGALQPLSALILAEPNRAPYQQFTRTVGKNGVGANVRVGFPMVSWLWNWLPQTDIQVLQGYEAQDVYIATETDTGVTARAYRIFACYAQPLVLGDIDRRIAYDGPNDGLRQRRPVSWEFTSLVEQV